MHAMKPQKVRMFTKIERDEQKKSRQNKIEEKNCTGRFVISILFCFFLFLVGKCCK